MKKAGSHLTLKERYHIELLLQRGKGINEIGRELDRNQSVISREVKNNGTIEGYCAETAMKAVTARRAALAGPRKETPQVMRTVRAGLEKGWAPEAISGHERLNGREFVSHEWIYQAIKRDRDAGGKLHCKLWCNRRGRKKRSRGVNWRDRLPNRVDISERPKEIGERERFGDWEVDLVEGKDAQGYLVTCAERKSRFTMIGKVANKTANLVAAETIRLLAGFKVLSITRDNGPEFASHEEVNHVLGCKSYFCAPYHSWERGLVENRNGLIRRYIPKRTSLVGIGRGKLGKVEATLNCRPHKILGWRMPVDLLETILLD